jgi:hypothetical protein
VPELIALGGARGVWDELREAQALFPDADIGAVNDSGADYRGHLKLFATLHPEKFERWQRFRERKGFNTDYVAVSHKAWAGVRVDLVKQFLWSGCSGLYLCQIAAMEFGYQQIILCGMPLTAEPHYFDTEAWTQATRLRAGWKEAAQQPELKDRIKSMSGWTREYLGGPHEWLAVPAS